MSDEPMTRELAAFEEWWNGQASKHPMAFAAIRPAKDIARLFAVAAWSHQQSEIDRLTRALTEATRERDEALEQSEQIVGLAAALTAVLNHDSPENREMARAILTDPEGLAAAFMSEYVSRRERAETAEAQLSEANEKIARLTEALDKYGAHLGAEDNDGEDCWGDGACLCGLSALTTPTEEKA